MDVVFIEPYKSWKKYEIVTVKDGFARNFLIPQGFCVCLSEQNRNQLMKLVNDKKQKEQRKKDKILKIANDIRTTEWELSVNVDSDGKITDKITTAMFVKMIKEKFKDCEINAKAIMLKDKVGTIGVIKANVKLQMGVMAEISVNLKKNT